MIDVFNYFYFPDSVLFSVLFLNIYKTFLFAYL